MTTITFSANNATIQVAEAHIDDTGDTLFAGTAPDFDAYELFGVKSIIPPKQKAPTPLQNYLMTVLQNMHRYVWDKGRSVAAAGVVLKRDSDGDFWFFGMEGEIMHNPDGITIKL